MFEGEIRSEYVTTTSIDRDGKREPVTRVLAEFEVVDHRLCMYAKQRAALDAAESYDLVRAQKHKLHVHYGFATLLEYLERRCGYDPHTARERLRVANALVALPDVTNALSKNEISYTHARELSRVVVPETQDAWLAAATGRTSGEVQQMVRCREKGDLPTAPEKPQLRPKSVHFEVTPEVFALVREARKVLADERGHEITENELVEEMCRRILAPGTGEAGPQDQVAYKQCPNCQQAKVIGGGRELDVTPAQFERAACDSVHLGNLDASKPDRAWSSVTPRLRAQVFARDGGRCVVPGCRSSRCLQVHHIIPQEQGGPHKLWNTCLLCSGHHAALHDGRLLVTGRAPRELRIRWTYGEPLPPNLDRFERLVEIQRRAMATGGEPITTADALDDLASSPRWVQRRARQRRRREDAQLSRVLRRVGIKPENEPDEWVALDVPAGRGTADG